MNNWNEKSTTFLRSFLPNKIQIEYHSPLSLRFNLLTHFRLDIFSAIALAPWLLSCKVIIYIQWNSKKKIGKHVFVSTTSEAIIPNCTSTIIWHQTLKKQNFQDFHCLLEMVLKNRTRNNEITDIPSPCRQTLNYPRSPSLGACNYPISLSRRFHRPIYF